MATLALGALLALGGCAAPLSGPTGSASPAAADAAQGQAAAAPERLYVNPVIDRDFPDPDTLKVGDTYYLYGSNTGTELDFTNIQAARSKDLVSWEPLPDALPSLPAWARQEFSGSTWAPEVTASADGSTYLMYFVTRHDLQDVQCIGVATSASPEGPFSSSSPRPLVCQVDQGGSIDHSAFVDADGARYLLWKNDGNCCGAPTWIYLQPLAADGLSLQGAPARLIGADQGWEGGLVEAPTLWRQDGGYVLLYSANPTDLHYAIGYARSVTLRGPYRKPATPLLSTSVDGALSGPGGQDLVVAPDGSTWLLYHSWDQDQAYRALNLDALEFQRGEPAVNGNIGIPQPAPAPPPG